MNSTAPRCACVAIALALVNWPTVSQGVPHGGVESKPTASPATSTKTSEPRLVILNVAVTDRRGNPITGLSAADFTVTENGRPQNIESFGAIERGTPYRTDQPQSKTILIFDKTRGPDGSDTQSQLIDALKTYNGDLAEPTMLIEEVPVRGMAMLHNYTRDGRALIQALHDGPSGDAFLAPYGSSLQSIVEVSQGVPGPKTVIWISSELDVGMGPCEPVRDRSPRTIGASNLFDTSLLRVQSISLAKADITLDVLLHPEDVEAKPACPEGACAEDQHAEGSYLDLRAILRTIRAVEPEYGSAIFPFCGLLPFAPESGGVMAVDLGSGVAKDIQQAMRRAANYYALSYTPRAGLVDGQFRQIHVYVDRPNVEIYARLGYYDMPEGTPRLPYLPDSQLHRRDGSTQSRPN